MHGALTLRLPITSSGGPSSGLPNDQVLGFGPGNPWGGAWFAHSSSQRVKNRGIRFWPVGYR